MRGAIALFVVIFGIGVFAAEPADTVSQKAPSSQNAIAQAATNQGIAKPLRVPNPPQTKKWAKIKELFL